MQMHDYASLAAKEVRGSSLFADGYHIAEWQAKCYGGPGNLSRATPKQSVCGEHHFAVFKVRLKGFESNKDPVSYCANSLAAHLLVAIVYFYPVVAADEGFIGTQTGLHISEAIHFRYLLFYP